MSVRPKKRFPPSYVRTSPSCLVPDPGVTYFFAGQHSSSLSPISLFCLSCHKGERKRKVDIVAGRFNAVEDLSLFLSFFPLPCPSVKVTSCWSHEKFVRKEVGQKRVIRADALSAQLFPSISFEVSLLLRWLPARLPCPALGWPARRSREAATSLAQSRAEEK